MAAARASLCLPLIDLSCGDRPSTARSIRRACVEHGFFYLLNHGIPPSLLTSLFAHSAHFFRMPLPTKMALLRDSTHRGYTPPYAETLDPSSPFKDLKESFYIGPIRDAHLNKWPPNETFPAWRDTMEFYYQTIMNVCTRLLSLIALSLDLDEDFFHKIGAMDSPMAFLRLLHYPGEISESDKGNYGASAHSDYGMITVLVTDGVPGLQICREKDRHPQLWEDVHHVEGALIVNIGDLMERWTNCTFRSTLHRVVAVGKERYSAAFFLEPNPECVVECLESCCSETSPPRFPPIKSGDYLQERLRLTYGY